MRRLSEAAPTDDEVQLIADVMRENHLAWLGLSKNKIRTIAKPLCELDELQWLNLDGT